MGASSLAMENEACAETREIGSILNIASLECLLNLPAMQDRKPLKV